MSLDGPRRWGTELPEYRVSATPTHDRRGRNKIHEDGLAREFGFFAAGPGARGWTVYA